MNRHERGLEFKVGAFVFIGLSILAALVVQFGRLVNDLRGTVQKIDTAVTRLNQDMLSKENADNLTAAIAHLNETTGALSESSKKLDGVIEKADSTMGSAKKAADDLQGAMVDA